MGCRSLRVLVESVLTRSDVAPSCSPHPASNPGFGPSALLSFTFEGQAGAD